MRLMLSPACRLRDTMNLQVPTGGLRALSKSLDEMAAEGLRVLGVARARFAGTSWPRSQHDFDFEFLGLAGLADPLRKSVPAAVSECRSAGIKVVMITGDYPATARAIARQAGIEADTIVGGEELEALTDADLAMRVRTATVFARIMPEQKLRIVNAFKANGEIVAMTGDGANMPRHSRQPISVLPWGDAERTSRAKPPPSSCSTMTSAPSSNRCVSAGGFTTICARPWGLFSPFTSQSPGLHCYHWCWDCPSYLVRCTSPFWRWSLTQSDGETRSAGAGQGAEGVTRPAFYAKKGVLKPTNKLRMATSRRKIAATITPRLAILPDSLSAKPSVLTQALRISNVKLLKQRDRVGRHRRFAAGSRAAGTPRRETRTAAQTGYACRH